MLDQTSPAVLPDSAVSVHRQAAVLHVELLQPPAVHSHGPDAPVRHALARLQAQLAQLGAQAAQHGQTLVRHLALAHVQGSQPAAVAG